MGFRRRGRGPGCLGENVRNPSRRQYINPPFRQRGEVEILGLDPKANDEGFVEGKIGSNRRCARA
jgi:hypothetical protein